MHTDDMNKTTAALTGRCWTFDCLFCEFGHTADSKEEAREIKGTHMEWHKEQAAAAGVEW